MSRKYSSSFKANLFSVRRQALGAAVKPLLEMLESRSLFSASPTANPGGPYVVPEGQSVLISGLNSTDTDGSVVTYQWDTSYDASAGFVARVTGSTWTFQADATSTRPIALRVIDNSGDVSDIAATTISVTDVAPTLSLTAPASADERSTVQANWTYSDPGASDLVTVWGIDWGDGQTDSYTSTTTGGTHTYATAGQYAMTLTSTQINGAVTSITQPITINPTAPTVVASTGDAAPGEGAIATVNFATADNRSTISDWVVNWGDGTTEDYGNFLTHGQHVYADDGDYTATVTANDVNGLSGSATVDFAVTNTAPTAVIDNAPATGVEGSALSFGSTVADPGVHDTQTYAWTVTKDGLPFALPQGTDTASPTFTFTPTDNGTYVATLLVTDNGGAKTTVGSTVTVVNAPPTGTISGEPTSDVNEGDTVNLTATPSDPGADDTTFTYAWTITKDGQPFTPPANTVLDAQNLAFVPTDNGTYVASVTITDKDGGQGSATSNAITVDNVAPTSVITGAPATSPEGTAVVLGATTTDPGTDDTQSYTWSVTKDGDPVDLTGVDANSATFNFTPRDNGAYVISLVTTDDDGGTSTTTQSFTVTNVAPAPTITSDDSVDEGLPLTMSVNPNDPGADDTQTYLWSVTKDGQPYTGSLGANNGSTFTLLPNLYGTYVVTAEVTDKDGGVGTVSKTITVNDVAPTVTITGGLPAGTIEEGTPITLTGVGSDVSGETGLTYQWGVTRRDGEQFALPQGTVTDQPTFTFTPTDNANYRVTLAVTDSGGQTGSATTSNIVVTNALPTATLSGGPSTAVAEGDNVSYSVTAADAGAEDTLSYQWSATVNGLPYAFANNVITTDTTFAFTVPNDGVWIVQCVVSDNDGGQTAVAAAAFTAANVAPTATLSGAPSTGIEGTAISVNAAVTDPGSDDVIQYDWSVTKDGQPYLSADSLPAGGPAFSFTPTDNGSYVISLLVSDGTDSNTYSTAPIDVANAAPTGTIAGPTTGSEGSTLSLMAAAADAGSDDLATLSFFWSVTKDGQAVTLPADVITNDALFAYTPPDNGAYVFSVIIADKDGGQTTLTHNVDVANVAPTAAITGAPDAGFEMTPINVSATASDVPADPITYSWSVSKDGQIYALPQGTSTSDANFAFTPTDNGSYVIHLTTSDKDGGSTTVDSAAIAVADVAPTAAITGDTAATEGGIVQLASNASDVSTDDMNAGLTYAWTAQLGDKVVSRSNNPNFNFSPNVHGTYAITLTVTDKDGLTTTATSSVNVINLPPTGIDLTGQAATLKEGDTVSIDAVAQDASGDTATYTWKALQGDNVFAQGTGSHIGFTAARGLYQLIITATDSGGASTSESVPLSVENVAPTGTFTPQASSILVGSGVNVGLAINDVPTDQQMTVVFDFGDNTTWTGNFTGAQTAIKKHVYTQPGVYTVTATVSDGVSTTTVTQNLNISQAAMLADPTDPTKQALFVVGGDSDDVINVTQRTGNGQYAVTYDGVLLGRTFQPTGRIYIYGNGGANNITVNGTADAVIFAGVGASTVQGGSGDDVIVGSAANDNLNGGAGRDIVIGAAGSDTLHGGDGDDLIVSGSLAQQNDVPSMVAMSDTWSDPTKSFAQRQSAVKSLFASNSLIADQAGVGNQVWGDDDNDWFVINTAQDRVRDMTAADAVN